MLFHKRQTTWSTFYDPVDETFNVGGGGGHGCKAVDDSLPCTPLTVTQEKEMCEYKTSFYFITFRQEIKWTVPLPWMRPSTIVSQFENDLVVMVHYHVNHP